MHIFSLHKGLGNLYLSSGAQFSGMWHRGKRQGHGIMKWSDGSYYDGEWLNDKRHGHGTYRTPYARGHMYVGMWEDGMKQGRGRMVIGGGESMAGPSSQDIEFYMSDPKMDVLDGFFMGGNFVQELNAAAETDKLGM